MAMNLPLDEHLVANINRRRIAEEQRKARIFNPRQRLIGVDVDALNHQVRSSRLTKDDEEEKERAFAEQLRRCDRVALLLQKQQEEEAVKRDKEIDKYRKTEQRKEDRREYDLYDPDQKKKELPPRISDDDPRCGPSGVQKLEGEDLEHKERTKAQKDQYRDWLERQMLEKRLELDKNNTELRNLELKLQQLDKYALQMANKEQEFQRDNAQALSEFNKNLARQRKEQEKQQQIAEELEKLQDIHNAFYGDLLSENTAGARSAFGPHRVVPDRWKGMTKDQIVEVYEQQKEQMHENKFRQDVEQDEAKKWDQLQLAQARLATLQEREQKRKQAQLEKDRLTKNHELARDQKLQQDYLKNVVYTNVPSEDYYTQFNTTTR